MDQGIHMFLLFLLRTSLVPSSGKKYCSAFLFCFKIYKKKELCRASLFLLFFIFSSNFDNAEIAVARNVLSSGDKAHKIHTLFHFFGLEFMVEKKEKKVGVRKVRNRHSLAFSYFIIVYTKDAKDS